MTRKALGTLALPLFLLGLVPGLAHAQTHRKVTLEASVPFGFVVGNRAFPPGAYVFEMATGSPKSGDQAAVLVVHGRPGQLYAAVAADIAAAGSAPVQPKLVFTRRRDQFFLRKIWRPGDPAGLSLPGPGVTGTDDGPQSQVVMLELPGPTAGL